MCQKNIRLSVSLFAAAIFFAASQSWSAAIPFFDTGVEQDGSLAPLSSIDSHWSIVAGPGVTSPQPAFVLANQRNSFGSYYATTDSQWIWATANGVAGINAPYTFQMSFDLSGFDPNTVSITGSWGVDNLGTIMVNGAAAIGTGALSLTNPSNFTAPNSFALTGGFHSGINTIDILATDLGVIGGLDVTALAGSATPVPLPDSITLMLMGLLIFSGVQMRIYRQTARRLHPSSDPHLAY